MSDEDTIPAGQEFGTGPGERTEPVIDLVAAQAHMPEGFPIIDPDSMLGRAQLAGLEIHSLASRHLAASNRALWRRVAELENGVSNPSKSLPPTSHT